MDRSKSLNALFKRPFRAQYHDGFDAPAIEMSNEIGQGDLAAPEFGGVVKKKNSNRSRRKRLQINTGEFASY